MPVRKTGTSSLRSADLTVKESIRNKPLQFQQTITKFPFMVNEGNLKHRSQNTVFGHERSIYNGK